MLKYMKLLFIIAIVTGCAREDIFEDYDKSLTQPMTFQVRQVGLEDIVAKNTTMEVRSQLVEDAAAPKEGNSSASENTTYNVSADILNIRAQANVNGEKIGELSTGDTVEVIERVTDDEGNSWAKIKAGDKEGYVMGDYLTTEVVETPIGTYRAVIYQLNMRSGPSDDSEVVGELGYFEQFPVYNKVTAENGSVWLKTILSDGSEAFVSSDYCVEVN